MKILHTSDLHIGKKLMGRERYPEYRAVLSEISGICASEGVELVLIAGDVFDTYTPSAEAEEIFYSGIKDISRYSTVLIISGNHDDYVRLTAAAVFAEEQNVYIVGNNAHGVKCNTRGGVSPVKSGNGYVIFQNERGEKVFINTLPYPNEARFKEGRGDESFAEKMARWIGVGESGREEKMPSVFLSHIFVAGGSVSDSEREIDLGGARAVPQSLLPESDYIALGHLHKRQHIGKNVYYCGAPMQFSFDESGAAKSVNIFNLTENGVEDFKQVEITSARKLVRLTSGSVENALKVLEENKEFYAELTLNLTAPMTPTESSALRANENLVSLKAEVKSGRAMGEKISNKNKSSSQLFSDYYKSRYGVEVGSDLLALFLSLTEEG